MYDETLGHKDPQMGVRRFQSLDFHNIEILFWDATV